MPIKFRAFNGQREGDVEVVLASEYEALEKLLASYQEARVHDVDEKAWLSKRVSDLEERLAAADTGEKQ